MDFPVYTLHLADIIQMEINIDIYFGALDTYQQYQYAPPQKKKEWGSTRPFSIYYFIFSTHISQWNALLEAELVNIYL